MIRLSPMTKAPTPTKMSTRQNDNTNNATKNSITDLDIKIIPFVINGSVDRNKRPLNR